MTTETPMYVEEAYDEFVAKTKDVKLFPWDAFYAGWWARGRAEKAMRVPPERATLAPVQPNTGDVN